MKISVYTAMKNCLRQDYPFLEMLHHHLPLADEIVINEGYSTDGTYEAIKDLDPKIKINRMHWERPTGEDWWIHFKDASRQHCTGDWCIHLDCDEFIPEWEFESIREHLSDTDDLLVPVRFVNFYGNYRVYHANPGSVNWVTQKMIIHRNTDQLEFWGDGSNLKEVGKPFSWETSDKEYTVHHFGAVRYASRLRQAWWSAGRFRTGRSIAIRPPRWAFNLFPHDWMDPDYLDGLAIYPGPHIQVVCDNPDRFIRDDMQLYEYLLTQSNVSQHN